MTRYDYVRYHDGIHWIVVDTAKRETVGFASSAWDAGQCADHLERGLPVSVDPELWSPDEPLPVRWPRTIAAGLLLGWGAWVAVVAFLGVLG